jgi:beta-glucanase (GH16 family)
MAAGPAKLRAKAVPMMIGFLLVVLVLGDSGSPAEPLFTDEFAGDELDSSRWNTCHWWDDGGCTIATNNELEWYLPSQVLVRGGHLSLRAEEIPTLGSNGEYFPYRSGMVSTGPSSWRSSEPKFSFTYGRVEARVRVPAGDGLWAALWMLPVSRHARPEIDILEILGNEPREYLMHLHPADPNRPAIGQKIRRADGPSFADGWHEVQLDWRPKKLQWFVDDDLVWQATGDLVPDEPMYLVANLAVGGKLPGPPTDASDFPATYTMDYVRVWAPPP